MSTDRAKQLRENLTDVERLLWFSLRDRQLDDYKFRRQSPIGEYVVDFVCAECKLVVEIDGGQHAVQKTRDNRRSAWLEGQGYRVIRFWNNDVIENLDGVLEVILAALNQTPSP